MSRLLNLKRGYAALEDLSDGYLAGNTPLGVAQPYWVDGVAGHDGNTGLDRDNAFKTIAVAIAANNATINWSYTPKWYNAIYIKPGVYAENLTSFPYYCWLIGCGIRGTDTAVEIHPTTGSCMTGTMLGTILYNLRFEVNQAVDCLNVGICNNSKVLHSTFANGAAVAATALSTDNCTHLEFAYNSVESGQATGMGYGLYFQGGADKYAHNCRIHNNTIFATTSGIWVQDICTASQTAIYDNRIVSTTIGIDDNNGGTYCSNNWITAADAIEHPNSSTHCVGNHVSNGGTGAMEVSGS